MQVKKNYILHGVPILKVYHSHLVSKPPTPPKNDAEETKNSADLIYFAIARLKLFGGAAGNI